MEYIRKSIIGYSKKTFLSKAKDIKTQYNDEYNEKVNDIFQLYSELNRIITELENSNIEFGLKKSQFDKYFDLVNSFSQNYTNLIEKQKYYEDKINLLYAKIQKQDDINKQLCSKKNILIRNIMDLFSKLSKI
jgi:hypothetical protein